MAVRKLLGKTSPNLCLCVLQITKACIFVAHRLGRQVFSNRGLLNTGSAYRDIGCLQEIFIIIVNDIKCLQMMFSLTMVF